MGGENPHSFTIQPHVPPLQVHYYIYITFSTALINAAWFIHIKIS